MVHMKQLNIVLLIRSGSYILPIRISPLSPIISSISLGQVFYVNPILIQHILKCSVEKRIYKKISTCVDNDKNLADRGNYSEPEPIRIKTAVV